MENLEFQSKRGDDAKNAHKVFKDTSLFMAGEQIKIMARGGTNVSAPPRGESELCYSTSCVGCAHHEQRLRSLVNQVESS